MALKIVRIADSENAGNPLWLWRSGQHDKALEQIARADAGAQADDARSLVELALAADLGHARAIGEALARWSDDIASYRVVKNAIERVLDQGQRSGPNAFPAIGLAIAELGLPSLRQRPWEPVLLNYVGVALYGLGEASLALSLFHAAGKLDPSVEHLRGNIDAARKRMRKPIRIPLAPGISLRMRELRGELRSIAGRATEPLTGSRVSLCMIVRDEEEMLPGCLESVQGGVDEIVIVDTGSTDRTVEIAESFGARVIHFPWTGSFSEARNVGLDAATGDHILWLDADEQLEDGDAARLRELAAQPWREAHWMVETNLTGQSEVGNATTHLALRLWRNRPQYRFAGAIHEQIRVSMPTDLGERFHASALRIRHYGYLKARIEDRDKHARNLALLRQELQRRPDDAFVHFNMGTEFVGLGDLAQARAHLQNAYTLLQRDPTWYQIGYAPLLASRLVGVLRSSGDLGRADALASELLERFPGFTDLVFERGLVAGARGETARARALFEECLELGDAPHRYSGLAGRGGFLALAALASLARESGDTAAAADLLQRSLDEHPEYLAAGLDLADTLLADESADPDDVLSRLEAYGRSQLTWWLFLGTAFYERGHVEQGEQLFRRALAIGSQHGAARVGLVEALLSQRRYDEVEQEHGDLPSGTPPFAAAQRARALAAVLRRDATALESSLAALAAGEETTDEVEAMRAIGAAVAGDEPLTLRPGAAPMVLRTLDALARLEEFEAFERTVPLLARALGDAREASILLAELYLARGFYPLAGESALDALEIDQNDVRALAVLAKSAVAQGMFAEAVPVLEACVALDPGQRSVQVLLAQVRGRLAA